MSFPSGLCGKVSWLCIALAFAGAGVSVATTDDFQRLLGEGTEGQEARIKFLRELGSLDQKPGCSLVPLFWERIDVVEGHELSLGLFRLERPVSSRDAPVGADVLSILIRHVDSVTRVWLRVGPWEDTGWIELEMSEDTTNSGHEFLFRSCSGRIVSAGPDFWSDPCQSREDCESQFFLWPRWVEDQGTRDLEWVPARSVFEPVPLGRHGVARWLLQEGASYRNAELAATAETVAASQWIWTSTISLADRLDPVSEHVFFPEPRLPESAGTWTTGSRIEPRISRHFLPQTSGNDCPRIFAPRAQTPADQAWGFDWTWKGLPEAETSLNLYTQNDGCLAKAPHTDFTVFLQNQHLRVRKLLNPDDIPIAVSFAKNGPYVFMEPGSTFFEVLVAANIFGWANQGLSGFDQVYHWLRWQVRGLDIYQAPSMAMQPCAARRFPGMIHLPLMCPGYDGFVAKGLCGDVVVHELAHEVMGSLVGLGTGGERKVIDDSTVNEALAYYFALDLKPTGSTWHYAPACQNDDHWVGQGTGDFAETSLLSALAGIRDRLQDNDHDEKILGRLLSLATLYGWQSPKKFFDEFFDFAQDKADVDATILEPICEELRDHAGVCDPRCPKNVLCYQLSDVEPDGDSLVVRGTFLGTNACPGYTISIADSGESVDSEPGVLPRRRVDEELGRFVSFRPMVPQFELVLEPSCPGMQLEAHKANQLEPARFHVAALPKEILKRPDEAESVEPAQVVAGGRDEGRQQLIVGSERGLLWSRQQRELGAQNSVLETRIWPGFSATSGGLLQGWTTTGRQITMRLVGEPNSQEPLLGDLSLPSRAGRAIASTWPERLLSDDPRLELLAVDAFGITLGTWPEDVRPGILRYPFAREIDPASLEIGLSLKGPVFAATERHPNAVRVYALRNGALQQIDDTAVFPLETPALSFRRGGLEFARELLEPSSCHAPPYVSWVGDNIVALSCDGVVAAYRLVDEKVVRRSWLRELGGILVSSVGAKPVQLGSPNGYPGHDEALILGPFRHGDESEAEDRIEIVDSLNGERIPPHPIRSRKPMHGAPAVLDLDGDNCDEVVIVTDKVEVWDPSAGLGDCR